MLVKTIAALHRWYPDLQLIFSFLSRGELRSIISEQSNSARQSQQLKRNPFTCRPICSYTSGMCEIS
jgi:hypothetical protein